MRASAASAGRFLTHGQKNPARCSSPVAARVKMLRPPTQASHPMRTWSNPHKCRTRASPCSPFPLLRRMVVSLSTARALLRGPAQPRDLRLRAAAGGFLRWACSSWSPSRRSTGSAWAVGDRVARGRAAAAAMAATSRAATLLAPGAAARFPRCRCAVAAHGWRRGGARLETRRASAPVPRAPRRPRCACVSGRARAVSYVRCIVLASLSKEYNLSAITEVFLRVNEEGRHQRRSTKIQYKVVNRSPTPLTSSKV